MKRGTTQDGGKNNKRDFKEHKILQKRSKVAAFRVHKDEVKSKSDSSETSEDHADGRASHLFSEIIKTSHEETSISDLDSANTNSPVHEDASINFGLEGSDPSNLICLEETDADRIVGADPFVKHFEIMLSESTVEAVQSTSNFRESEQKWPVLGPLVVKVPETIVDAAMLPSIMHLSNAHIRANLLKNIESVSDAWTDKSTEVFSLANTYLDLYCFGQKQDLSSKRGYCLHVLNHVLKTRSRIIAHNSKINRSSKKDVLEFRDQGFTRPKVLILVPFRQNAYQIFEILSDLLAAKDEMQVMNRKRFIDEFGWKSNDPVANSDRPEDFREAFAGNTDDCFRIGVSIAKKTLKLFTEFYSADIIIASPLGLRMIIGNEDEKQYEYDFLSSIEILVMDQADIFLMQNWEHVSHIMKHLHRQPKMSRNVDFTRVRSWTLNGWSKFYRQTLIFSTFRCPEIQSLISRCCSNYAGSVTTKFVVSNSSISSVAISAPHVFCRILGNDFQLMSDLRFKYFTEKLLPQFVDAGKSQTMIFIPSYFDFVRVRNHMKRQDISFVQICEYSSTSKVARARDLFFHGKKHFLLYTERFHFFRRYHIRGIRHLVFYELPHYAHYYPELCNMLVTEDTDSLHQFTINSMFSKFDTFTLTPIVGLSKASSMLFSDKPAHMFVTTPDE